jgi:hypothetical protein
MKLNFALLSGTPNPDISQRVGLKRWRGWFRVWDWLVNDFGMVWQILNVVVLPPRFWRCVRE